MKALDAARQVWCFFSCRAAFLLLFPLLIGCGGGKCASNYVGSYSGTTQADKFVVDAQCNFTYTGVASACISTGTYGGALGSSGSVTVNIASVTGTGNCIAAGNTTCTYSFSGATSGSTATLNCGDGTSNYSRQ